MLKTIFLYGLLMASMVLLLKLLDYHFLVKSLSMELYVGLIAALFTGFGIWMGLKLTGKKNILSEAKELSKAESSFSIQFEEAPYAFELDTEKLASLNISTRGYEVLQQIAKGLSNQEIADKLFISPHTVKTHSSKLFSKLGVKRRTQAVQKAREMAILP